MKLENLLMYSPCSRTETGWRQKVCSKLKQKIASRARARARPFEGITAHASPLLINLKRDSDKMTVEAKIFFGKRLWLNSYS